MSIQAIFTWLLFATNSQLHRMVINKYLSLSTGPDTELLNPVESPE